MDLGYQIRDTGNSALDTYKMSLDPGTYGAGGGRGAGGTYAPHT
jgi:hypothetical protein